MVVLALIIAVIALVIAILAYQKVGGITDVKRQIEHIASSDELKKSVESLAAATETLKEKTDEAIGKLETTFKGVIGEEKEPPKKAAPRKRATRTAPKTEKKEEPS
jgi:predicted PurR-regulated permease PerM